MLVGRGHLDADTRHVRAGRGDGARARRHRGRRPGRVGRAATARARRAHVGRTRPTRARGPAGVAARASPSTPRRVRVRPRRARGLPRADRGARERATGHAARSRTRRRSPADARSDRAHRRSRARTARDGCWSLALRATELLEERPTWGPAPSNQVLLRLEPLSNEEAIELVRQAGGGRIADDEASADRGAGRRQPVLHRGVDRHAAADGDGRPPTVRGSLPPTVQAMVASRLDALPPRHRDLARRASVFRVRLRPGGGRASSPDADRRRAPGAEDAEIIVREEGGGHAAVAVPPRDAARRGVREPAQARTGPPPRPIAERLLAQGPSRWAADHLELAALASLDLDPQDRRLPERGGRRAARGRRPGAAADGEPLRGRLLQRALALAGPEDTWGVREARALGRDRRGAVLARASTRPPPRRSSGRSTLGTALDDDLTLALALRFLGDIAINVDADLERREELLERSLAAAERARRAVGDRAFAAVRRMGAVDARPVRGCRGHLAARARDRRRRGPVGAGPRAHVVVDQPCAAWSDLDEALRPDPGGEQLAETIGDQFSVAVDHHPARPRRSRTWAGSRRRSAGSTRRRRSSTTSALGGSSPTPWRSAAS